jgi:hypothetical protein
MAYILTYKVHFTNEQNQEVLADIYKKNGSIVSPVPEYMCSAFELSDKSEGQTKYESTIIARELILTLWSDIADEITWETFITAAHDDWKIIVKIDGQLYFEGFITPDEGNGPFQDKPYEVTLRATNGLSLLKGVDLVDVAGDDFDSDHKLIDYIAGALKQTGLDLPIRIHCGYFNRSMNNKAASINNDMFNQAYLNYRTFQATATTFINCYDALVLLLNKFCRLEYWFGYWQIKCIGELQFLPGSDYYVDYDANGANPAGAIDTENHAQIGKSVDIYAINEDQQAYSRYAIKSAKTIFNYEVWPEIPKNNKFERGAAIPSATGVVFETDQNGDDTTKQIGTYQDYTILDWAPGTFNNPPLLPPIDTSWRRSTNNKYGVEVNREIVIEKSTTNTQVLESEGLPVYIGDKVSITFDYKLSFNFNAQLIIAVANVYIVPSSGGAYYFWRDGATVTNQWRRNAFAVESIFLEYVDSSDKTKIYKSVNLDSQPIPVDGTLYVQLINVMDNSTPNQAFFRNFDFQYRPFVAGGYIQVKGDYWFRSQNVSFPDVAKEEVQISDSPKKMLKGSLLVNSELAESNWFRYGMIEKRKFKELLNIARFNHSYRRMYAIEGTFNGLNYAATNNQLNKFPIGFHKRYRLVDMTNQRDFVLVPPLKMDLIKGWVSLNLVEVVNPADITVMELDGDFVAQKLVDLINFTTEAEWTSGGSAPASGTPYFPPVAAKSLLPLRSFYILLNSGNSVAVVAFANGAGNSPSISTYSDVVSGDLRTVKIQIGADVAVGNLFRVTIYGRTLNYIVAPETRQNDGTKAGDNESFNYIF